MFSDIPYVTSSGEPADASAEVYFYGLSFCDHCTAGKQLLEEMNVPFAMVYLDQLEPAQRRPVLRAFRETYGKQVIYPVLEVNGNYTFGFNREVWSEILQPVSQ